MHADDAILNISRRLLESQDEAEIMALAEELRRLLHECVESARLRVRVLPLLDEAPKRKKAA